MLLAVGGRELTGERVNMTKPDFTRAILESQQVRARKEFGNKVRNVRSADADLFPNKIGSDVVRGIEIPKWSRILCIPGIPTRDEVFNDLRISAGQIRRFAFVGDDVVKFPTGFAARFDKFPFAAAKRAR